MSSKRCQVILSQDQMSPTEVPNKAVWWIYGDRIERGARRSEFKGYQQARLSSSDNGSPASDRRSSDSDLRVLKEATLSAGRAIA